MSKLFKQAEFRAKRVGINLTRLRASTLVNGTVCHFTTKQDGKDIIYHYGFKSIFDEITEKECLTN